MKFVLSSNSGKLEYLSPNIVGVDQVRTREANSNTYIIDVKKTIHACDKAIDDFLFNPARLNDGIIYAAFLQYVFPWACDIFKVYCFLKIIRSAFAQDDSGRMVVSGSFFQSLTKHGTAYICFTMLPWAILLIDQIAAGAHNNLLHHKLPTETPAG